MSASRVSRLDGALKVRGQARFAAEVAMEGLLYAAVVHSTIARGRIAALDTAAAEAAPGVALVMTHRNAPRMKAPEAFGEGDGVAGSNLPMMQDELVHWNGEAVAVVLADTQEQADHAAGLVAVDLRSGAGRHRFRGGPGERATLRARCMGEPAVARDRRRREGAGRGAHRIDCTYSTPP